MQISGQRRRRRTKSRGRKKRRKGRMTQYEYVRNAGLNIFGRVMNTPLPTKLKATLRYFDFPTLDIGVAGAPATHVYSASDLYDPDRTGAGGQPRGFDQLMALYDHFVVIGSKCVMKLGSAANTNPVYIAIDLKDTASPDSNLVATGESSFMSWDLHSPAGATTTLVQTYSPKFLGRSYPLSDPDLKGSDAASPDENGFYHIMAASPFQTNEAAVVPCVVVEYTAMFIEPKRPSAS